MDTVLVPTGPDPLLPGLLACGGRMPAPVPGRQVGERLEVDETLPERLRRRLCALGPQHRPSHIVLGPAAGADPFGPDPYLQSATFLTAAAALEAGVGVGLLTRGVPARGFGPLFGRYPGRVVAQVAVSGCGTEPAPAASWSARRGAIAALAATGIPTWIRLDPVVPARTDESSLLAGWLEAAAAAGARGVVVVPLVLDDHGRELVSDDSTVVDYYRPGRRRRRGVPPAMPAPHLPLERETALVWRVRRVAEDAGLPVRLCRCARGVPGSCGLAPPPLPQGVTEPSRPQLSLWAG